MEESSFLLDLALILLSTKVFGLVTKQFQLPQVVGALIAGIVLGPAFLNIVRETEVLSSISELGVIVLMFSAGLETDVKQLKTTGKASFIIALFGMLIPLGGGFLLAQAFDQTDMLQNAFIGVILTATSVSITVETLKELGKISSNTGSTILGAALVDDILGIIGLTIVTSMSGTGVNLSIVLFKILAFFVFAGIVGVICHIMFTRWVDHYTKDLRRFIIISFVICLLLAHISETIFGVADITGAFIAGLIITNTSHTDYIESRFEILSYIFLSPIFFASIGLQIQVESFSLSMIIFTVLLTIVAILTKVYGCYFAGLICKFNKKESLQIGAGMVSRGEVSLIMLSQGTALGMINDQFIAPIIIMVILTTIISPILLKITFKEKNA